MTDPTVTEDPIATTGEPDVPDAVHMLDSGRIRFVIDGITYTLRRPRMGEVKALRLLMSQHAEDNRAADAETALTPIAAVERDQAQMFGWLAEAFRVAGDKRLPDDPDDLPPWLANAGLPARMIAHWQSVPLAAGAPS